MKTRFGIATCCAIALTAAGCGQSHGKATAPTATAVTARTATIVGQLWTQQPTSGAYSTVTGTVIVSGPSTYRVQTDQDGRYTVKVMPGRYEVSASVPYPADLTCMPVKQVDLSRTQRARWNLLCESSAG